MKSAKLMLVLFTSFISAVKIKPGDNNNNKPALESLSKYELAIIKPPRGTNKPEYLVDCEATTTSTLKPCKDTSLQSVLDNEVGNLDCNEQDFKCRCELYMDVMILSGCIGYCYPGLGYKNLYQMCVKSVDHWYSQVDKKDSVNEPWIKMPDIWEFSRSNGSELPNEKLVKDNSTVANSNGTIYKYLENDFTSQAVKLNFNVKEKFIDIFRVQNDWSYNAIKGFAYDIASPWLLLVFVFVISAIIVRSVELTEKNENRYDYRLHVDGTMFEVV